MMKIWLHTSIGDVLRHWLANSIDNHRPRLCVEIEPVSTNEALDMTVEAIRAWHANGLLVFKSQGEGFRGLIIDEAELAGLVAELFQNEEVFEVIDPTMVGGCSFDITEIGERKYCLSALAWGRREDTIRELTNRHEGVVFRGN